MTKLWAEIGINHQGSVEIAIKMIDAAQRAGADLVKFQMRVPELAVPKSQWDKPKVWQGQEMTYLEYKKKLELSRDDYYRIDRHCAEVGINWTASVWDYESAVFLVSFADRIPFIKIPSAKLTDHVLLKQVSRGFNMPIVLSTGMSTVDEIEAAIDVIPSENLVMLLHCNSSYPACDAEQNLSVIETLRQDFNFPVGFSSHHKSPFPALYAAARYGVPAVETHFTLDRSWEGTDHASSLESDGLELLAREFLRIPIVLGDGQKVVYDSELPSRLKLRGY
jgi:N-acetylneuraminate synthase